MELLDLYDNYGKKLNETIIRGREIPNGKNIMLSVIFIKSEDGKYLIQKTSKQKGNKYSTTGGHVISGETAVETIKRELKEELGIKVNDEELKYITLFKYPQKSYLFNVFLIEKNETILSEIELQNEEVEEVKFLTIEEILHIIKNENFLETHAYIIKKYIIN